MEITVNLSDKQVEFLKKFAKNHAPNSPDNLCTANPIHVVQDNRHRIIPYGADIEEYMDDENLVFMDRECDCHFDSEVEFINQYYEWKGEEPPEKVIPFKEAYLKLETKEEWLITTWEEYFGYYGVKKYHMGWKENDWQDVAFFFILEEARKYIMYQRHNLKNPRTYTFSGGYSNKGEYHHFWELLFNIGKQLSGESEEKICYEHSEKHNVNRSEITKLDCEILPCYKDCPLIIGGM